MFNRLNQILIILTLSLCVLLGISYKYISSIKAKNVAQAQTISSQLQIIQSLKEQAKLNEQLTLEISKLESELRSKADESIKQITNQEKSSKCYSDNAPRSIVDFLQH